MATEQQPLEPDRVVTVAERATRLAGAMIESTTEYDAGTLPLELEVRLGMWCAEFIRWADER